MFPAPTEWKHQLPVIQAPTCITENKSSPLHHPATLVSLAATRWKLQLPVFKHPLEPLRTTVLPSTSRPPWNIKLCFLWIYYSDSIVFICLAGLSLFNYATLLCLHQCLSSCILFSFLILSSVSACTPWIYLLLTDMHLWYVHFLLSSTILLYSASVPHLCVFFPLRMM